MQINKAYIFGTLNKAIFFENDESFVISGETNSQSYPLLGYEWSQIRSIKPEYYISGYSSIFQLKESTCQIHEKTQALEIAIELMDSTLSSEYRSGIAEILVEKLEKNEELFSYVKNRLLSTPTPDSFNPEQAYEYVLLFSKKIAETYFNLRSKTKSFSAFYTILKFEMNLELEKQDFVDQVLTDLGFYAKFSEALYENSKNKFDSVVYETLKKLQELHIHHLPNLFFEIENKLRKDFNIILKDYASEIFYAKKDDVSNKIIVQEDEIKQLINIYFLKKQKDHDEKKGKRGKGKKVEEYNTDTFDIIEVLKDWVKRHDKKSDEAILHEFRDIIKKQLKSSFPEQLCKTCCDLAAYFTEIGRLGLTKKLLGYAKLLNPEDPVIYSQEAELLRKEGFLDLALERYEFTIQKFDDVVDYCGKAETLRDMGKLDEALMQYQLAIQKFDSVVAYCGKAETLRDMGKFDKALMQYELSIQKFDNDVAYNGKAETLRDMGKFDKALMQYELSIQKFGNAIAYHGKAETLREMGKLEEALIQYELAIRKFDDVVAFCGKAETLRDMGKLDEALNQYELAIQKFDDAVAYNGKAETLRDIGKLDEALRQYDLVIQKFDDVVAYCGKAESLRDMGKLDEALKQYDLSIQKFDNVVAYNGKSESLRDMGKLDEALIQYDLAIQKFDNVVSYSGKAETLRDMGKLDEALKQYDLSIQKFDNVVSYSGKAETLRDMGKLDEALKQYNLSIQKFDNAVAYSGKAETLRDMGKLDEALKQYDRIISINKYDINLRKRRLSLLLETNQSEKNFYLLKKDSYSSFSDYINLHVYTMFLVKSGNWIEAKNMIKIGLKSPFNENRSYFKSISSYLRIIEKDYQNALTLFDSEKLNKPFEKLLAIHAYAGANQKSQAIKYMHQIEYIKRPVIKATLNYLSERYSLNGHEKTGKPNDELDKLIIEGEMKTLLQY